MHHLCSSHIFSLTAKLLLVLLLAPADYQSQSYGSSVNITFDKEELDLSTLAIFGDREDMHSSAEGVTIANDAMSENTGFSFLHPISGDFSVETEVKLLDYPFPEKGYGTGAAILVEDQISRGASLQFVRTNDKNINLIAHWYTVDPLGEYKHSAKVVNTSSESAALRLRREGNTLHYEVDIDLSGNYLSLHSTEFTDIPMRTIHAYVQTGGQPNNAKILFHRFNITADEITNLTSSHSNFAWVVALCAIVLIALSIGAYRYMQSNHNRTKPGLE